MNTLADTLPAEAGTYVLMIGVGEPLRIVPGRLGAFDLPAGLYAYVGSAHGAGGLRARVGRHLRAGKKVHWHVDALTALAQVVEVWASASAERVECEWARALAALPGAEEPIPGFGASDCACPTHLLRLPPDRLGEAWRALGQPARYSP